MIERLMQMAAIGPTWVLWGLLVLSVVSVATIVERAIFFRRRRLPVVRLTRDLEEALSADDLGSVRTLLKSTAGPEAVAVLRTMEWFEDGPESMSEAMEAALREQRIELEHGLAFLGTVGNNAPFLGLLGTVLGVVKAFQELSTSSGAAMGSVVLPGIAEALIATALGITVALPAVVAYNAFTKRADETEENVRALTSLILAHRKSGRFGSKRTVVATAS